MKILIVDDDKTTRKILSLYLKEGGFNVTTAENGLNAMEKLGSDTFQLVMTDLNMPFMDGIEFIKAIKANPGTAHIPALMLTAETDGEEKDRAFKAGADGYLSKPVTAEELAVKIRQMLEDALEKGEKPNGKA
ncbi:MAG: response regulator [Syntrophorhabdaceae bacterium]|nr:response regulator [Syntrophorhabdaceae bacterium]